MLKVWTFISLEINILHELIKKGFSDRDVTQIVGPLFFKNYPTFIKKKLRTSFS